jgi:hypothetical protein
LAEAILAATEDSPLHPATTARPPADVAPKVSPPGNVPVPVAGGDEPNNPNTSAIARADLPRMKEPLRELTLGRSRPSPVEPRYLPGATTETVVTDADLRGIEARCRLKAEGARRASARLRRIREGTDSPSVIAPEDPEIAAWADRMTDCFYWTNSPDASQPAEITLLDDVGGCFETIAESIALVLDENGAHRGRLERALPLLAEAQSALRVAIRGIHAPDDPDQLQVYGWLKATAARHRVYLKRFMRVDDPADPSRWPDLLDRIGDSHVRGRSRQQGSLIDGLRPHLEHIKEGHGTDQDWQEVIRAVGELGGGPGTAAAGARSPPRSGRFSRWVPARPPGDRPLPGDP